MPIDPENVVTTALAMLDEDGLDQLSLRKLAARMDVRAPALYWHFDSKRALLDRMTDHLVAPVTAACPVPDDPGDWARWMTGVAVALRVALLAHPDGGRVALGANLLRTPALATLTDRIVAVLHDAGLDLPDASRASGAFVALVLGRVAEEQARPVVGPDDMERAHTLMPVLTAAMAQRDGDNAEDTFRFVVGLMTRGLGEVIDESRSARSGTGARSAGRRAGSG